MKKQELTIEMARVMYQSDNEEIKNFALSHYPELNMSIMDRVKSFDDAFNILYHECCSMIFDKNLTQQEIAFRKLCVIAEVLNDGVVLDWEDLKQPKYIPYFDIKTGVLVYHDTYNLVHLVNIPKQLHVSSEKKAEYFGTQFIDLWRIYLGFE